MKITFGKFQDWDTDEVAKAGEIGRNYLSWGADNLRSPTWRKEFERALKENKDIDKDWAVKALVQIENITYEEAEEMMDYHEMQEKKDEEHAKKEEELNRKYLDLMIQNGIQQKVADFILDHISDLNDYIFSGKLRFSSPEKKEFVEGMVAKYWEEYPKD